LTFVRDSSGKRGATFEEEWLNRAIQFASHRNEFYDADHQTIATLSREPWVLCCTEPRDL